ncbi:MAG: hypothetical protein R3F43_00485 [bacterium]
MTRSLLALACLGLLAGALAQKGEEPGEEVASPSIGMPASPPGRCPRRGAL